MFTLRIVLYGFTAGCTLAMVSLLVVMLQPTRPQASARQGSEELEVPKAPVPVVATNSSPTIDASAFEVADFEIALENPAADRELRLELLGQWEPTEPGPGWDLHIMELTSDGLFSFTCWKMSSDKPKFRCIGKWRITGSTCYFTANPEASSPEWRTFASLLRSGQASIPEFPNIDAEKWTWKVDDVKGDMLRLTDGLQWMRSPFKPPDQKLVEAAAASEHYYVRVYEHISPRIGRNILPQDQLELKVRTLCCLGEVAEMSEREVKDLFDKSLRDARSHGIEPPFALDAAIDGASLAVC